MSDYFSENLREEEKDVCLIDDHVWIGLGAFFKGCVKEMCERVRWHFFCVDESCLEYGVDSE